MAAVKSQGEQFLWLDNSFMSVGMKSMDLSHSVKRSRCSALTQGKRKTAKLQCSAQKEYTDDVSLAPLKQNFNIKCNRKVYTDVKRIASPDASDAGENDKTKAVSRLCSPSDSYVHSPADGYDEVHSFSKQGQMMTTSLVFTDCSFTAKLLVYVMMGETLQSRTLYENTSTNKRHLQSTQCWQLQLNLKWSLASVYF